MTWLWRPQTCSTGTHHNPAVQHEHHTQEAPDMTCDCGSTSLLMCHSQNPAVHSHSFLSYRTNSTWHPSAPRAWTHLRLCQHHFCAVHINNPLSTASVPPSTSSVLQPPSALCLDPLTSVPAPSCPRQGQACSLPRWQCLGTPALAGPLQTVPAS